MGHLREPLAERRSGLEVGIVALSSDPNNQNRTLPRPSTIDLGNELVPMGGRRAVFLADPKLVEQDLQFADARDDYANG